MPLLGTISVTDFGWYEFLSRRHHWDEVNFWTPSAHRAFRATEFSPFLFKLKAPHNAIAGFGFFARYAALPDWLAWDCFAEANGCASMDDLRERIKRIRRRFRYTGSEPVPQIGCIIIVNAVFFRREAWIKQPSDWPVRVLTSTRYDLGHGEGHRVWAECRDRAKPFGLEEVAAAIDLPTENPRYGDPIPVQQRLGQGAFRVAVTDAYRRACAATGEHSLPALEAAHIRPFAKQGPHHVSNGLLLRADLHRLFDQGYLTVTPDRRLVVSDRLRVDFQNGRSYYPLHGAPLSVPGRPQDQPRPDLLQWHNENIFLG